MERRFNIQPARRREAVPPYSWEPHAANRNAAGIPAASPDKTRSRLVVAEQRAVRLFLAHLAIEKLVVVEIDLDKRRTVFDAALDQGLRQRVLHVLLQGPAQRTRSVAAVGDGLFQNP